MSAPGVGERAAVDDFALPVAAPALAAAVHVSAATAVLAAHVAQAEYLADAAAADRSRRRHVRRARLGRTHAALEHPLGADAVARELEVVDADGVGHAAGRVGEAAVGAGAGDAV